MPDGQSNHAPTATDELLYEVRDGVGWVTLNRPQARNALTFEMYEGLATICREMPTDGSVHALVVTGAGEKAFAAGTDISLFLDYTTPEQGIAYEIGSEKHFQAYEACPVPMIAAISGACTGGGAAIAACADMRFATESLKFGFPISKTLGNCLSVRTLARCVKHLGEARTKELIITSRLIRADEAKQIGLVNEVLPDHAALMARVTEFATGLKDHAPLTMQATKVLLKRLFEDGPDADDHDWIGKVYSSADFKEGREAFLEKRKPIWRAR
ncbi:MAG: enoyl-CoA hydratase [Pseudomonadota bacterium]